MRGYGAWSAAGAAVRVSVREFAEQVLCEAACASHLAVALMCNEFKFNFGEEQEIAFHLSQVAWVWR